MLHSLAGCRENTASHPEVLYDKVADLFIHGSFVEAHKIAQQASIRLAQQNAEWAWQFRLVDASILQREGKSQEVLSLLSEEPPGNLNTTDIALQRILLQTIAYMALGQQENASKALQRAKALSADNRFSDVNNQPSFRARTFNTWGFIYLERGDLPNAEEMLRKGLGLARQQTSQHNYNLPSILLNLNAVALQKEHFDQALAWSEEGAKAAKAIDARILLEKSEGNVGWADYKLGNFEEALERFQEAEKEAEALNAAPDRVLWLTNIGLSLYRLGHLQEAESYYINALRTAESLKNPEREILAHEALAELFLQSGDMNAAAQHTDQALAIARSSGRADEKMDALFLQSLIATRQKKISEATQTLVSLDQNPTIEPSLRWQVESALANVYWLTNQPTIADKLYRRSITTFETQRETIKTEESKLPFSTNADQLYDDYVRFLVDHNKTNDALRWLGLGRARTLEEGLGIAATDFRAAIKRPFDPPAIARRLHGTILVYSLAQQESYLWAINASGTRFFKLPPQEEIDAHVKKYQRAILDSRDPLTDAYADGMALYRTLVEPAASLISKGSPVYIIPDGSLTRLNFETLLAPGGGIHYWIKDVIITNASSLTLLATFHPEERAKDPKKLLLIGNPISPDEKFPDLPNASAEVRDVASHFPSADESIFVRQQAQPSAYINSRPGDYSLIHFVAHGTSSSASPLDSAIVLTRSPSDPDSFKLYARDVIQHPLHADLVAISACYGSGSRVYGGEGLVGLSWAFLRAGAHYVIGSLWEVSDSTAPQIMDHMYGEIATGRSPAVALRDAKLAMLLQPQSVYRKPLYWATFQLYGGA